MNLAAMGGVFVAGLYQRLMKLRVGYLILYVNFSSQDRVS